MRSLIAVLLPVLAGALVYVAIAIGDSADSSFPSPMLFLPALLIGVMVVALVLLPLWSVLVHNTTRIRLAFVCISAAILITICAALAMLGAFKSGGLEGIALVFVPGLVLVTTFGMLMDPRRVRGGEKQR